MIHRTLACALAASTLVASSAALAAPDDPPLVDEPPLEEPAAAAPGPRSIEDAFDSDDDVVFDGDFDDVFGAGDTVAVRADIGDNAFLAGRDIHVTARIGGDLFAAGETIRIDRPVQGDVFAFGADVFVAPEASVGGNLYGGARSIVLEGPVDGSLFAGAGRVEIASTVAGDVEVEVGELVVRDGAAIRGDLDYAAPRTVDGLDAIVDGDVTFTERTEDDADGFFDVDEEPTFAQSALGTLGWMVWDYLSKLIVGAMFLFLTGAAGARVAALVREKPAESLGIGFLTLITVPPAALLCILTLIPMSLGVLGLLGLGILMFLGQIVTARWLGDTMVGAVRPEVALTPYGALAVGLVPVSLVFHLPWISFLAVLTASLIGMGAIVTAILRRSPSGSAA